MKLAWATDIHLNFIDEPRAEDFCREITDSGAEALIVTGDIAESHDVEPWLRFLEGRLVRPIYFVLGNHDYYGGFMDEVRKNMIALTKGSRFLRWMQTAGVVPLTASWGMVGCDGWGDARFGDYSKSPVQLTDFRRIRDIIGLEKDALAARLREIGDDEANVVREVLPEALDRFENILFVTHVPPFLEACTHEGKVADDNWSPYFACKAVGEVLLEMMKARPDRKMTVLCGHTHSSGEVEMLPNLRVLTGGAEYTEPVLQQPLIEV